MVMKLAAVALLNLLLLSACVTVVREREPYDAHGYYYDSYDSDYQTCHRCFKD